MKEHQDFFIIVSYWYLVQVQALTLFPLMPPHDTFVGKWLEPWSLSARSVGSRSYEFKARQRHWKVASETIIR